MLVAGLDIGWRTIALVEWDGQQVARADTGASLYPARRQDAEQMRKDLLDRRPSR